METIQATIRSLGITGRYKGYRYIVHALELTVARNDRLEAVVKEIYMETADHFGCSWITVERNIRTVVSHAWQVNPGLLREMAGYPLNYNPEPSEFIEIVAMYIINSNQEQQRGL